MKTHNIYERTIQLPIEVDVARLLEYIAQCLRQVEARNIVVSEDRVVFDGGAFRMVPSWNVLGPFGWGEMAVSPDSRTLRYRLSYRQMLIVTTVMVAAMGLFMLVSHFPAPFLLALPLMWAWLLGGNLVIGKTRFDHFMKRSLDAFQIAVDKSPL